MGMCVHYSKEAWQGRGCMCVCLVGVMNGLGMCIIDPFLEASGTWTGIKMIHGLIPGLISLILRYQTTSLCGRVKTGRVDRGSGLKHNAGHIS